MPIEFECSNCGRRLQAKDTSLGKRARCSGCQAVLQVPAGSPAPRPNPPGSIQPSPSSDQWYVKAEDGQHYGPVSKQELDDWVRQGRIMTGAQILRDGADQWEWAAAEYR